MRTRKHGSGKRGLPSKAGVTSHQLRRAVKRVRANQMPEKQPPTIRWKGQSGTEYLYYIYSKDTTFNAGQPGNYVYAKEGPAGYFTPVYIGQTNDLNERLCNHEQEGCCNRNGATHVHVHSNASEQARLGEEKDLILRWKPVCNTQHCG